MTNKTHSLAKWLIGGGFILAVIYWLLSRQVVAVNSFTPEAARDYIRSFGSLSVLAYIALYALNTISVMPPIAILSLAAGLLFGKAFGAVYLMIGAMLGTSITFVISRYFARNLVTRLLKGRLKSLDEKLEKIGFGAVLFFRLIPLVPYEILNYASGVSGIKFRDYFLASFLGFIPGVIIAAFFGESLGEIKNFKDIFTPKFMTVAALMLGLLAVPLLYRAIKKKPARLG